MYSPISPVGRKILLVLVVLLLLDIIVIALAARVNIFQEFYFMADLFPLGLSIATLVVLSLLLVTDFASANAFTSRPAFKIGIFFVLSILWLAFNIFSTMRWRAIPMPCSSVPSDFPDERVWCEDVQALKSFVWILFVGVFLTGSFVLRYTIMQHNRGNRHIWKRSLARFNSRELHMDEVRPVTYTDYFGNTSGNAISGPQAPGMKW